MHCRVCNSGDLDLVVDFGEQPLTHMISRSADVRDEVFPLKIHCCARCGLPQIVDSIDPEKLYTENDDYFTSDRPQPHAPDEVASLLAMAKGDSVIEIACNDGFFLKKLREAGVANPVGVEPNIYPADAARADGFKIIDAMLTPEVAHAAVAEHGEFDALVARGVVEHIPDLDNFFACAKILLEEGGFMMVEVPDVSRGFALGDCSMIFEEHVSYFTDKILSNTLLRYGFEPQLHRSYNRAGGCMTIIAQNRKECTKPAGVHGPADPAFVKDVQSYADKVARYGEELRQSIQGFREKGFNVSFYGAGFRTCMHVNVFGLAPLVDFILDDDPCFTDCFLPGSKIPIYGRDFVSTTDKPLLCLLAVSNECELKVSRNLKEAASQEIVFTSILSPRDIWRELASLREALSGLSTPAEQQCS